MPRALHDARTTRLLPAPIDNNPERIAGEVDPATGLRIHFELASRRPHAVGILTVGQVRWRVAAGGCFGSSAASQRRFSRASSAATVSRSDGC